MSYGSEYRRTPDPELRRAVLERDGWICQMCHKYTVPAVDHKYPWILGGRTTFENLQVLCQPCNSKKSDKLLRGLGFDAEIDRREARDRGHNPDNHTTRWAVFTYVEKGHFKKPALVTDGEYIYTHSELFRPHCGHKWQLKRMDYALRCISDGVTRGFTKYPGEYRRLDNESFFELMGRGMLYSEIRCFAKNIDLLYYEHYGVPVEPPK